jgi:hypothetical protein
MEKYYKESRRNEEWRTIIKSQGGMKNGEVL